MKTERIEEMSGDGRRGILSPETVKHLEWWCLPPSDLDRATITLDIDAVSNAQDMLMEQLYTISKSDSSYFEITDALMGLYWAKRNMRELLSFIKKAGINPASGTECRA
jgi:hypothetical protein